VVAIDGRALGMAVVHLGGGRLKDGDRIDPSVGLSGLPALGDEVVPQTPLATIHAASAEDADRAEATLREAIVIGEGGVDAPPLVWRSIG
jgi:thymidine phosphorylase